MTRRRTAVVVAFALLACLAGVFFLPAAMGRYLVAGEPPCPADLIVVLAGDSYGRRILRGAELARQGFAPHVLVDGPSGMYGYYESDLAIPFAVKHGYAPELFIPFPSDTRSTREEMQLLRDELARRRVQRVLIVTSDYHTRRTSRILGRALKGLQFCVVAAPDEYFRAESWWRSREARKIFVMEWSKTVAEWLGL